MVRVMPGIPLLTAVLLHMAPQLPEPQPAPTAPAECGRCHTEIHREWQGSAHATAFTDPIFQKSLQRRRQPAHCLPCHVPERVLERLGNMPRARAQQHEHGITCVACHDNGAGMQGPFDCDTQAHPTQKNAAFTDQGSTALCASCHATAIADVLPLARDFAGSSLPGRGKTCAGCHMPELVRALAVDPQRGTASGPQRGGRSHQLLGPGDPAFCKDAFALRLERRADGLQLAVRNAAGHRVPGIARVRSFPIAIRLRDGKGRQLHERQIVVSSDDPLLVDEERQILLPDEPGTAVVEVSIDHVFHGKTVANLIRRELKLQ